VTPLVSIIVLNYGDPSIIDVCLRRLAILTQIVPYEVVVVDNTGLPERISQVEPQLQRHLLEGRIDKLVFNDVNRYFSGGNNDGVAASDSQSEYLLFLNSDVAVIHQLWLCKLLAIIEGTGDFAPNPWATKPTVAAPGPLDILSAGWSHDVNVQPSMARPEGFCLMMRRSVWRPFDENFPWHYGWEHTVADTIRDGARCGVLFNYAPYLIHREGASGGAVGFENRDQPDLGKWFAGLNIETLDFTLGPDEHSSYMEW
jgi:hypothetical protein